MHPTVRDILDSVVIEEDGFAYVDRYAMWVVTLRKLPHRENSRIFVQLAVISRQFFDAGCKPVGTALAALARIGLVRLMRENARKSSSE